MSDIGGFQTGTLLSAAAFSSSTINRNDSSIVPERPGATRLLRPRNHIIPIHPD
jgi:hypothetical protein